MLVPGHNLFLFLSTSGLLQSLFVHYYWIRVFSLFTVSGQVAFFTEVQFNSIQIDFHQVKNNNKSYYTNRKMEEAQGEAKCQFLCLCDNTVIRGLKLCFKRIRVWSYGCIFMTVSMWGTNRINWVK